MGVAAFLLLGAVLGGIYAVPKIKAWAANAQNEGDRVKPGDTKPNPHRSNLVTSSDPFPRRMLFVHVSNYLYLNPLTSAQMIGASRGKDRSWDAALRLAYEWRVPRDKDNDQLYVVSDTAPAPRTTRPVKSVIQGAYTKFFETSRPQDRVVVYFGGHVLTRDEDGTTVAYLVPTEGDPDDPNTLIPLADFYGQLAACPATQKVMLWDVCRFNPDRAAGSGRGASR